MPLAETISSFTFKKFAEVFSQELPSGVKSEQRNHEQRVWDMASILFDDNSNIISDQPPPEQTEEARARIRKEKLQVFWQKLVEQDALAQVNRVKQSRWVHEEKAFLHLSAHRLIDACEQLIHGNDFRLATMVSLAGSGDEVSRSEMATQLQHWRDHNVLSEIPESVRALYELLAGNTSLCEGKERGATENRVTTFRQSIRFKLDWRRSFGLRLWYGTFRYEPLEVAVTQYASDYASGKEEVRPIPWFVEQTAGALWPHYDNDKREDILWGLLKHYAAQKQALESSQSSTTLESILAPENLSPNPLHARLAFQLACLLSAQNTASFKDPTSFDKLTIAYASQLSSASYWLESIFTLLHLASAPARETAIRAVLTRHAGDLDPTITTPSPATTAPFSYLVNTLRIPAAWIHQARAVYARSVLRDPALEIAALIKAGDVNEAHAVLCRTVAPRAVIANDLDRLRESLGEFERVHESMAREEGREGSVVRGWENGGGVYFDFVLAMDLATGESARVVAERRAVLRRLVERLPSLVAAWKMGLEERVAVWEMGRWVTEAVRKEDDKVVSVKMPGSLCGTRANFLGAEWS